MFVDPRRGSGELLRPLQRLGVPAKSKRMQFADFRFRSGPGYDLSTGGTVIVGIERKRTSELLEAVNDSRFRRRQLSGMLRSYGAHAWLLAEGVTEPNHEGVLFDGKPITTREGKRMILLFESGFARTRHLYHNHAAFQATIQAKARMLYWRTCSDVETVHWLASIYRWYQKPYKDHKAAYVVDETKPDHAILTKDNLARRVIAQLPGVGWDRSRSIVAFMKQHHLTLTSMFAQPARIWRDAMRFKEGRIVAGTVWTALNSHDDDKAPSPVRSRH